MPFSVALLAVSTALVAQATAPLAVQAQAPMLALAGAPAYAAAPPAWTPNDAPPIAGPSDVGPPGAGHAKECYAKVKFGAQYSVAPPTGPHFSWRQEPGPPGSPGPIWCLVPEVGVARQVLVSPEHYGWIRVLCDTEATPGRIVGVQRQLSAAGVYQGPIDGRYDSRTTAAVERFQAERHIEDRGYLSYATLSALSVYSQTSSSQGYPQNGYYQAPSPYPQTAYPPAPPWSYRPLTTFETGVLTWPGKR